MIFVNSMTIKPQIRSAAIVIKDNSLLVMERNKDSWAYFAFPGGGVEDGERTDEAAAREVLEECSIEVGIEKLLYSQDYDDGSKQYFYLAKYLSGEVELNPDSEESRENNPENYYKPQWISLDKIGGIRLYPLEIRDLLLDDYKNNFVDNPRKQFIKMSELRRDK